MFMFPCLADHEQDGQRFSVDSYSAESSDYTHINIVCTYCTSIPQNYLLLYSTRCTSTAVLLLPYRGGFRPYREIGSSQLYCFIWKDRLLTEVWSSDESYEHILRALQWKPSNGCMYHRVITYTQTFPVYSLSVPQYYKIHTNVSGLQLVCTTVL